MNWFTRIGLVAVLGFGVLEAGCSKSPSGGNATTTTSEGVTVVESDPNASPMSKAAYEFLDAVIKGDTQRASAKLTPTAMQRIVSSGKQFAPPGLESATFKIGQVVAPSQDQAIVQCVLTDSAEGATHSEEMCCLLRKVDNDWRICGIAYGTGSDKPWTLSDFETGNNMAIPRQMMSGNSGGQQMAGGGQANPGVQSNAAARPVNPPAPLGAQPVGPANVNAPNPATAGLGMPAVGAPAQSQPYQGQQPLPPYTAQEPNGAERR